MEDVVISFTGWASPDMSSGVADKGRSEREETLTVKQASFVF